MTFNTIFLLIIAIIFAAGLSFFQYLYKTKIKSQTIFALSILRFIAIFGLLLLLINPIITRHSLEIIKTPLPIVIDNSSSITDLKANTIAKQTFEALQSNSELKNKFDVQFFSFDSDFRPISNNSQIDFTGKQSAINLVSKNLKSTFKNQQFPTVLITDGNQTAGADYVFSFDPNNKVYPIAVGDTTKFLDLKINQINVNKYAFLKNKFPVEIFLNYSGTRSVTTSFSILQQNRVISKQSVTFSNLKKSQIINVMLPANSVGLQTFTAVLAPLSAEKNTYNNSKKFAVEVLDQKTEVAIVSSLNHPDIGALKRSIETNAQRKVTILTPQNAFDLQKFNVIIYYQPNASFKSVFDLNKKLQINTFIITGNSTDFNFLNQIQNQVSFEMASQKEDYLTIFDSNFNLFAIDNIGFENFPPLENLYGTITPNQNCAILLNSKIRNVATEQPLLLFAEQQGQRTSFLFGENSWKWRAQSFLNEKSFDKYDVFIDKIVQYLATNNSKKSLIVNHERFYNLGDAIEIEAQYFNKNYELDQKAQLSIAVKNVKTKKTTLFDFLKTNTSFKVNLDGLEPGNYSLVVKERNSNSTYVSSFEILDFDIEKQFVNSDFLKLQQLSQQTNGITYLPNQIDQLIRQLISDENYKAIQKNVVTKSPLIDWIWLLVFIALCLSAEWFIRKYNGLL